MKREDGREAQEQAGAGDQGDRWPGRGDPSPWGRVGSKFSSSEVRLIHFKWVFFKN